jgi:predicted nucleotidyltransferase
VQAEVNRDAAIRTVIGQIVRRLVEHYEPQRIILFGSYAHGEPDEDSDIDLLIIKETAERFVERMDTVRRLATGTHPRIPFEPIVLTPDEVEQRLKAGDQFIAEIIEKGEVLHAA